MKLHPSQFTKDPDAVKPYTADLTDWLTDDDTVSDHEIVLEDDAELEVDSSNHDDTSVTVVLSGGKDGTQEEVTFRVTTADGIVDDGTIRVRIREQ